MSCNYLPICYTKNDLLVNNLDRITVGNVIQLLQELPYLRKDDNCQTRHLPRSCSKSRPKWWFLTTLFNQLKRNQCLLLQEGNSILDIALRIWIKDIPNIEVNNDKRDKRISQTLTKCIREQTDLLVTYYGTGFDIPFMRSRAMYWGNDFPEVGEKYHLDMYYRAKSLGKLHRNSLEAHTQFLKIDGKNHVLGETWQRARLGEPEALDYVVEHNVIDVTILERLYERYRPYFRLTKKSI